MYEFAKENCFDERVWVIKALGINLLKRLFLSSAIIAGSLKKSYKKWLSSIPSSLCDRLKIILQERQADNNSIKTKEEIIATADIFLRYKCISTKHSIFLNNK